MARGMDAADQTEYPSGRGAKGAGIFCLKFMRILHRARVASDVTGLGRMLLSVVALKEDELGYSKAPTFWDSALQEELGDIDQKTLARVRRKCVESGWLHYEHGRKGKAGRYFVVVPKWASELIATREDESFAGNIPGNNHETFDGDFPSNGSCDPDSTENFRRIGNESGTKEERKGNEKGSIHSSSFPIHLSSSSSQDPEWRMVEERLRGLKVAVVSKAIDSAKANCFTPPQILALVEYLESNPPGCKSPGGAIFNRLVHQVPDSVEWMADENWPWSAQKCAGEDYDGMMRKVNPVDPQALAAADIMLADRERTKDELLEDQFGEDLDRMTDDELTALCRKPDPRTVDRYSIREIQLLATTAAFFLSEHGRDEPKTRLALLRVIGEYHKGGNALPTGEAQLVG